MRTIYGIIGLICSAIGISLVGFIVIFWFTVEIVNLGITVIITITGMSISGLGIIFGIVGIVTDRSKAYGIIGLVIGIITIIIGGLFFWFAITISTLVALIVGILSAIFGGG
jgi:hypothetical protein